MEAINIWIDCILATIILIGIIEVIVPEGEIRKFVLLITGVIASAVIATPVIKVLSKDFSLKNIFDVESIDNNFYYIDTLKNAINNQSEILEEVFAGNVVEQFNSTYRDMQIDECKISFLHDKDGKIIEINEVYVKHKNSVDDIRLLKNRVADICEVSIEKVRVS